MRRIYDENSLKIISLFESISGAKIKDCINEEEKITFIIDKGSMGLAIGKHAQTLNRIESLLKKPVKMIEFDEDVIEFIRHIVFPINMFEISIEGKIITIKGHDTKTKGILIGRERSNLKKLLRTVKRFFDIDEIKVV
jgi:transcription termination/antitermination protein NusA